MLTFLLWLSPVIVIAVIVWQYRRQAAAREAASNERLKAFLGKTTAQDVVDSAPFAPVSPVSPASTVSAHAPAPPGFAARGRLLTPPQTLLYYLLKSSLSDHEVLAQVSAASIISVSGFEREERSRRLTTAVVDFVVCDKSFKAVAVVQCGAREGNVADSLAFARTCCESAALRWVEVMPDALPKRETIRSIVLGA